jgi:hypothetical protein
MRRTGILGTIQQSRGETNGTTLPRSSLSSDYWMPAFAGMTTERIRSSFAGRGPPTLVLLGRRGQHAGHHDDKRNREPDQVGMKHKA